MPHDYDGGEAVEAFVMEVAGLAAFVQPMFFSTREYCRPYNVKQNQLDKLEFDCEV